MLAPRLRPALAAAAAIVFCLATLPLAAADAQPVQEYAGISLFRTYCSVCHGVAAKGDGPMADQLRYRPPDLTLIAKRNGGTFPADDVFRMIDGRKPLKGHGGNDMPIWGDAFKNSREGYDEAAVKGKIEAVVEYLAGIQELEAAKK
jgi:mono/diheme cytochrome c family protein